MTEAQTLANEAVQKLADRIRGGDRPPAHGMYYPDRPFREQVLHEIRTDAGDLAAVVTRNSYGCQVLNTARVMFVDIDLPEPKSGGFFKMLFGKAGPPLVTQEVAMAKIEKWSSQRPEWGWRIYRTRAGLRLMATHALVEPNSPDAEEVFEKLGADPLYRKLCQTQKCFRARLTPKPWRCGIRSKPARWPWLDARQEKLFQKWDAQYQSFSFNWATCALLSQIGNPTVHPEVQPILKLHDGATRVESDLRLA
ncbi:MAG TPA: hypothetical protein VG754_11505 [Verrucomicrobiae bacterium]|jgi:hypothetical protein|nr:hypothetical protein [Verrucomicrobiae bacterium]